MKLVHKISVAALSMLAAGAVSATPLIDTYLVNPDIRIGGSNPSIHAFIHSFLDEVDPYVPGFDTISSAILTIRLQDNGNNNGGSETFRFVVGPTGFTQTFSGADQTNAPTNYVNGLGSTLASLSATGILNVSIIADSGSFRFMGSTLEADITRGQIVVPPVEVPEPLTLALAGIGLAGMYSARRRALKK